MKKVLVIGANGFLGNKLTRYLMGKDVEIVDWNTGGFPYSILGNILYPTYSELASWTASGRYLGNDKVCEYDLFIEEWI